MKRVIALILILGGMILMNSPPKEIVMDYDYVEFSQTSSDVVIHTATTEMIPQQPVSWLGGLELKYPESSWSATYYVNQPSVLFCDNIQSFDLSTIEQNNYRLNNYVSSWMILEHTPFIEGLTRLDIGELYKS